MIEVFLKILRACLTMLNSSVQETGQPNQDLMAMAQKVTLLVTVDGAKATHTIDGVTPLMLYAATGITDERFTDLIRAGSKADITQFVPLQNSLGFSALTLAAATGNLKTLELLYNTNHFTQEQLEEAVYFAATLGQAQSITFLHQKGVNLFKRCLDKGNTALHVACATNHSEVVQAILATHPSDDQLSTRNFLGFTAFKLAIQYMHSQCAQLFENKNTDEAFWLKKRNALRDKDLPLLEQLLQQDKSENPFIRITNPFDQISSLVVWAAALSLENTSYKPVFERLLTLCSQYSIEIQINTLLVSIVPFAEHANDDTLSPAAHAEAQQIYITLTKQLQILQPQYHEVKYVVISNLNLDEAVTKILSEANPTKIEFVTACPDIQDKDGEDLCTTVNLWPSQTVKFLALILKNTQLIECNLLTDTRSKPLRALLDIIIERNKKIADTQHDIVKDTIYNHYVPIINAQIQALKSAGKIENAECLIELNPIQAQNVYSLVQYTSFFIANTPRTCATSRNICNAKRSERTYSSSSDAVVKKLNVNIVLNQTTLGALSYTSQPAPSRF